MVVGFNHNIRYKGELFHVQTEDSGRANPHIVTLLYRGGTILGSAKTSYADIIKTDQLELVVESIMKEQHKDMMRRLKGGEFDDRLSTPAPPQVSLDGTPLQAAAPPSEKGAIAPLAEKLAAAMDVPGPAHAPRSENVPQGARAPQPAAVTQPAAVPQAAKAAPAATPPASNRPPAPLAKRSLDEVILDYLITGQDK
jgi:hypothetical protein